MPMAVCQRLLQRHYSSLWRINKNPQFVRKKTGGSINITRNRETATSPLLVRSFSHHSAIRTFSSNSWNEMTTHSKRGQEAIQLLPSYLADARSVTPYCPTSAPNGAIQLSVAENQMMQDEIVAALKEFGHPQFLQDDCIYYQATQGRPSLCAAMARYLEQTLDLQQNSLDQGLTVVGSGCNAVLENLCFTLAEPGHGVLIPTPYYAAFEFDLVARAGLVVLPMTTMKHCGIDLSSSTSTFPPEAYYPTRDALDHSLNQAREQGVTPRILLLSHPQNPLGICYPPSVVQTCIDWCREHKIHLVSDEIYGGSVYDDNNKSDFVSALNIATKNGTEPLGDYVHLVYALSKDLALSGLRVGACYTENKHIQLPLQKLNDLCQISSQTQVMVEAMLTAKNKDGSSSWISDFLRQSRARIRQRSLLLQNMLQDLDIPHLTPNAGLFCWVDLTQFLTPPNGTSDAERERALYLELVHDFGILLTPGLSMKTEQPGFFRCVFTAANDKVFELFMSRFRQFVKHKRGTNS